MLEYKVVELSLVTDESIEKTVNTWIKEGWTFDQLQFAMANSSKRPAMAFVFFVRDLEPTEAGSNTDVREEVSL